jgi:hypothetical protein
MPNIQVRLRRGSATDHDTTSGGFTGAEGEVTVDTTNDTLRVHDGSTPGGIRLAKHDDLVSGAVPDNAVSTAKIVDGAVTTVKIADDGVTFAKMQNINTAKVIGRTTAGSGDPEEVTILDEDTMTSDSATALATQQSIKAYVDSQVLSKYDSGWFNDSGSGLSNGSSYAFSHTLGTTEAVGAVWMAKDANGTDAIKVDSVMFQETSTSSTVEYGAMLTFFTNSSVTVQLSASGWTRWDTGGNRDSNNWGTTYTHIKVVLVG